MIPWTQIGKQQVRVEPDLVFIRIFGRFSLSEADELIDILDSVREKHGRLCLLFDGTHTEGIDPDTRRRFIKWASEVELLALANFGGGLLQRTLAFLLYNALRLIAKKAPAQTYVSTEEEARTWLTEQRNRAHQAAKDES